MNKFEQKRIDALQCLNLLDTPSERRFDKITEAAKTFYTTKIALFSLVDEQRQWFKSKQGLYAAETPRSVAFCDSAIKQSNVFIVKDARTDDRFKDNPLVTGSPYIRFYAGAPVREPRGFAVGTLCIIDDKPRDFVEADLKGLRLLADILEHILIEVAREQGVKQTLVSKKLDRAIQRAQTIFLTSQEGDVAFDYVLQDLLDITNSSYGLIGEVHTDEARYLKVKSITNLSWNKESEALYRRIKSNGMFFRNQDNVLGMPLKTGEVIIANDLPNDNRAMGRPDGHPKLDNYIGIPIFVANKLVALVGLANRQEDFSSQLVEDIAPLLNTIGNLIERNQLIKDNEVKQKQLEEAAYYDELTGLPNRRSLRSLFEKAKQSAIESDTALAVCFIDLDGFKEINDTFGHNVGDHILRELSDRLQCELRENDIVARLGGDEFVIVLTQYTGIDILERLLIALRSPFTYASIAARVTASIGYTLYPDDNGDLDTLLRHADQAMYAAKQNGKNQVSQFDVSLHSENSQRLAASEEIKRALEQQEFELFYQPQININEDRVVGFEALIRWRHPQKGIIGPQAFIDIIEHTELARALSLYVIDCAVKQLRLWQQNDIHFSLSINLSSSHFLSRHFESDLSHALDILPHAMRGRLKLEVLETVTSDNIEYIENKVNYCRNLGVFLSLDDFGTGYSSLDYFRRLKVHEIKIDRTFITDLINSEEDIQLVRAIISLSNTFGRAVIAEGIESQEVANMLSDMGCTLHQGYHYCKPLPVKDALRYALNY